MRQLPSEGRNEEDSSRLGSMRDTIMSDSKRACRSALAAFTSDVMRRMHAMASPSLTAASAAEYR